MNENGGDLGGASASGGKSWERSWTTEEMRQNAHAWNLAGDAGLLKHLQEFSQTVLTRTHATEKALDSLVEDINTLTSEANTTNNKFLCLANTQFVENRVYDDDEKETPHNESVTEKKSKEETEVKMIQKVREALSMSVAVLDSMFEPVEIQASDSEGESDGEKQGTKTLILEPHNPYIHRPLPHLIGSEAFMSDDRIGLIDSPSDEDEQPMKKKLEYDMEASSESDVDFSPFGSTKRTRDFYSSQSSVLDHKVTQEPKKIKPNDSIGGIEDDCEVTSENQAARSTSNIVPDNDTFTTQLAAKLGRLAPAHTNNSPSVEKATSQIKTASDDLFGGAHSEDEDDALFSGKSGLFSGPPKLFDDVENTSSSLWGPESDSTYKNVVAEPQKAKSPIISGAQPQNLRGSLFSNSLSDEDNDLFAVTSNKPSMTYPSVPIKNKPESEFISSKISKHQDGVNDLKPGATSTPEKASDEESHANLSDPSSQNKKPTGGVPMFGKANVLAGLKAKIPPRPASTSSESSTDPLENDSLSQKTKSRPGLPANSPHGPDQVTRPNASFGSASSPALASIGLPSDDRQQAKTILNSISSPPVASNHDNDSDNDDIFSKKSSLSSFHNPPLISGDLFAEVNDDEDDLFAVRPPVKQDRKPSVDFSEKASSQSNQTTGKPVVTPGKVDENSSLQSNARISTVLSSKPNPEKTFPQMDFGQNDIYSTVPPPLKYESKVKKPVSLFDDSDSGEDELLFSSASSAGSRRSQTSTDILAASVSSTIERKSLVKKGLFDDDDTLFGNVRNDPGIDIFSGASKTTSQPSTVMEPPQPLSKEDLVEENSSLEFETGSMIQRPSVMNSDNALSAAFIKTAKPVAPKSTFDNLFADASDEDNSDIFSSISKTAFSGENILASSIQNKNVEDDAIFCSVPKRSFGTEQPSALSGEPMQDKNSEESAHNSKKQSATSVNENEGMPTVASALGTDKAVKSSFVNLESKKEETVQKYSRKPEPPRTLNIRKETDPSLGLINDSDDDNLFGSAVPKVALKPKQPHTHPEKPVTAARPVAASASETIFKDSSESVTKIESNDSVSTKLQDSEVDGAINTVSKLRSSLLAGRNGQPPLKIDPRALIPGQKPPPLLRRTPPKEDMPDEFSESVASENNRLKKAVDSNEQPIGFDKPVSNTILPSANKDRAKLGHKRRPPSSKARREAARASMNLDPDDRESPLSPDGSSIGTVNNSLHSSNSVLSPSTDEDDLFGVPQDLPLDYGNQNVPSADIFSGAPVLSPITDGNALASSKIVQREKESTDKAIQEKTNSSLQVETLSEILENPSSDLLFDARSGFSNEDTFSNQLFATSPSTASKSANDDLFAPAPKAHSLGFIANQSLVSEDQSIDSGKQEKLSEPLVHAIPETSQSHALRDGVTKDGLSLSTSLAGNNKLSETINNDGGAIPLPIDNSVSAFRVARTSSDPLNKASQLSVNDEEELFGTELSKPEVDDNSSLFPFVKKKPTDTLSSNRPLFSQTPALPSKSEKTAPKQDLGALNDPEDDELFISSNKFVSVKKIQGAASALKTKENKMWNFSDEDDDDLFQGVKSVSSITSSKANTSSSNSSLTTPAESKTSSEPSKHNVSQDTKKSKLAPSAPKNGLFSDENDDDTDDLFSKKPSFVKSKGLEKSAKPSLFDEDDGDELFGSKQTTVKSRENKPRDMPNVNVQGPATSKFRKENLFDDPLMALQDGK